MGPNDDPEFDRLIAADGAADEVADGDVAAGDAAGASRVSGWRRVFTGNRALWLVAAAAVVALVAGLLVGRFVLSPADAAASGEPPEAGLVTVPVEFGALSNDVTIRGEVAYADAVDVTIDTSGLGGAAVVTGNVPEVGAMLDPLSVALTVSGRPVIVLPGELPAYRSLAFGMTGPDVVQFKQAMAAVGIDAGDPASDVFDEKAAAAVGALYAQAGYTAPVPAEGAAEVVSAAEDGVGAAQLSLASARADLSRAGAGASAEQVREADVAIAQAQRELAVVQASKPADPADAAAMARWQADVGNAQDNVGLAQLRRQQLDAAPDTASARAGVQAAEQQLADAQRSLARARQDALPTLPAGEVLYLTDLPRRVDAVNVTRGQTLQGAAMTVSGATIALTGSIAEADAALLAVGDRAVFDLPDGAEHAATVEALTPGKSAGERWSVTLTPEALTTEQAQQVQGRNVRVTIPVGSTSGEVLYVPVAALTAGPGGESRVEVVEGDPRDGERAQTRIVVVETGLAAGGQVEVTATDGDLGEGDLVVVGR